VQLRTDVDCARRIDCTITFFDVLDLAFFIHHERGAVRKLELVVQDAVFLGDLARHVAEQREFHANFFGKCLVRRGSVDADAKYRGVVEVDLTGVDTSLVCLKFFRSTASKRKHVER
jgi:hypothetical protein